MECDGMRASTSRNQLNGSSLFSSQELTKSAQNSHGLPAALPICSQVQQKYAQSPIQQVSALNTRGGLTFPGVGGAFRDLWNRSTKKFMGLTWRRARTDVPSPLKRV